MANIRNSLFTAFQIIILASNSILLQAQIQYSGKPDFAGNLIDIPFVTLSPAKSFSSLQNSAVSNKETHLKSSTFGNVESIYVDLRKESVIVDKSGNYTSYLLGFTSYGASSLGLILTITDSYRE